MESDEATIGQLGRQRPACFTSLRAEVMFCFSIMMSQILAVSSFLSHLIRKLIPIHLSGIFRVRLQRSHTDSDRIAAHPQRILNMARHCPFTRCDIDSSHLWPSFRHVWWIYSIHRRRGLAHDHIDYLRAIPNMADACRLPSSARSCSCSSTSIWNHDSRSHIPTRATEEPRFQHLRSLRGIRILRGNLLRRCQQPVSQLEMVLFFRCDLLCNHTRHFYLLDPS